MGDDSYEAYKRNLAHGRNKRSGLRQGKLLLVTGACLLLYFLYIFPFSTGSAGEMRGGEMKAGSTYDRIQIYYIEDLQILCASADTDGDKIYCAAKFTDGDQNDWMISFTPGSDEALAEEIQDRVQYSSFFDGRMDLRISGYFQMQYLEEFPSSVDRFYSAYGSKYVDADGATMLNLNADYLCKKTDNYMLALLSRPGMALGSLVISLIGIIYGGILLVLNRSRQVA